MTESLGRQVDICIVSWRTRDLLRACLGSLAGEPEVRRVIVVENASGDGTAEMLRSEFPQVLLIANPENRGYAAANNQAIEASSAPFVLLLNPDTEVKAGAIGAMLEVFDEDRRIGAVAPQLLFPDGRVQPSCRSFPEPAAVLSDMLGLSRLFPRSSRLAAYRMAYWDHGSRRDVDQPMASAIAIRRAALDEVGLFDEAFPLYFNDVDLCYRLKQAGWRIVFEPRAKVLHHHGQSTRQVRARAIIESHQSLVRFYRKHYRGRACRLCYWSVVILAAITMYPRAALARIAR